MAECHWLSAIAGGVLGSATEDARGMVLHGGVLDYQNTEYYQSAGVETMRERP